MQQAHRRTVRFAIGTLASLAPFTIVALLAPGALESRESAPSGVLEDLLFLGLVACKIISVRAKQTGKGIRTGGIVLGFSRGLIPPLTR